MSAPGFLSPDDVIGAPPAEPGTQTPAAPAAPDPRDAELAQAREAQTRAEQRADQAVQAVLARQPAAPPAPVPVHSQAPDPMTDPEGFRRWAEDSQAQTRQAQAQAQAIQAQNQQRMEASMLWTQFQTAHPEWAHSEGIVSEAYQMVTRGQPWVGGNAQLFDQVAARASEIAARAPRSEVPGNPDPDAEPDPSRALSVSGASGPPASAPTPSANDENTSLIDQLHVEQEKMSEFF